MKSISSFIIIGLLAVVLISPNTKAESPSSESRLPFLLKASNGRFAFFVESDAKHISAFDMESGRLMWSKDLSKEWEEDWKRPNHGLKACSILSLKFGTEKYSEFIVVELNDGKIGFINMESGTTRSPISD
jgi:hypothetical protein